MPPPRPLRWFQFSLGTWFRLLILLGCVLATWPYMMLGLTLLVLLHVERRAYRNIGAERRTIVFLVAVVSAAFLAWLLLPRIH